MWSNFLLWEQTSNPTAECLGYSECRKLSRFFTILFSKLIQVDTNYYLISITRKYNYTATINMPHQIFLFFPPSPMQAPHVINEPMAPCRMKNSTKKCDRGHPMRHWIWNSPQRIPIPSNFAYSWKTYFSFF